MTPLTEFTAVNSHLTGPKTQSRNVHWRDAAST
ncbi:hypothetical protein EV129_101565 [Rhizobium azibense]|uniref:Uncharacterized protein n=1 Tax=Rhizobium azibense TaxID=1136135 RepID=A0A4R3S9Q3_9HYPH|nr:hypothetical protein EV129_101565 [Rhizobium azibense]